MKALSRTAAALMSVALASPCWAGQVKLEIHGGLVTLSAKDASVREILSEWSRVGQTRIVNAERVPGGLLNIELNGVPEAKALDIVLRSVAGYVAAPRAASAATGSRFDRIVVMAMARPPAGGASPAVPVSTTTPQPYDPRGRMGGFQPQPAQPSLMVDDQDEPVVQPQPQPASPTAGSVSAPQPGMPTAAPVTPGPVAPGQAPATPYPPGQQPNSPAAQRPGVMTPATPPKPPGSPGGGPGN